jgi:hypothetical protein
MKRTRCPSLALLGRSAMSDLSLQSDPKRTWTNVASAALPPRTKRSQASSPWWTPDTFSGRAVSAEGLEASWVATGAHAPPRPPLTTVSVCPSRRCVPPHCPATRNILRDCAVKSNCRGAVVVPCSCLAGRQTLGLPPLHHPVPRHATRQGAERARFRA